MNSFDTKDPQTITDLMRNPKNKLGWIINRASMMHELERLIHDIVGHPLSLHIRVGNYDKAVLTLIVNNASTATQLRYQTRDLINQLHFYPKWAKLYKIDVKVRF